MAEIPTSPQIRDWANVSVQSVSDEQLDLIRAAELALQAATCSWVGPDYPDALAQALLRRCARELGSRQLPLGLAGDSAGEYAPVRMPSYDVEVERLEAPYRVIAVA